MNLRSLSNDSLLVQTKRAVREEREATTLVLHHLREVERRMLYAALGYSSMTEYAVKELKYSESAAKRRVWAMQMIKELPEVEQKIEKGELTLETVVQAHVHFNQTKTFSPEEKKEILEEISNLSSRACERMLAEKRGDIEPPETRRAIAGGKTQYTCVLDQETEALLREVEIELGRTLKMKELVKEMARLSLQVLRKRKAQTSPKATAEAARRGPAPVVRGGGRVRNDEPIPTQTKRAVWRRDNGRCQFREPRTGTQCECTRYVQVEHIIPRAHGGSNELENLELLCRAHNNYRAVQVFGHKHMNQFVMSLS